MLEVTLVANPEFKHRCLHSQAPHTMLASWTPPEMGYMGTHEIAM